ncbi:MAG: hypothetical protein LUD69_07730 [Oscillospiraceae bacterium]|nr:hypothetical protein [Oscillospiraceae bacterium]
MGLSAVVLTTSGPVKAILLLVALCVAGLFGIRIFLHGEKKKEEAPPVGEGESSQAGTEAPPKQPDGARGPEERTDG